MPMPRKNSPKNMLDAKRRIPNRMVLFSIIRDESGSMARWREKQGQFIPAITEKLRNIGGPEFIKKIYLQYTVISGGVVYSSIGPMDEVSDPKYKPDGCTPLGTALGLAADQLRNFIDHEVLPNEISIRNLEILLISDCLPSGEQLSETRAGIEKFSEFLTNYRAFISVVVPNEEAKAGEWVQRVNLTDRPIRSLSDNPEDLIQISFESVLQASRKIGVSDPHIRN